MSNSSSDNKLIHEQIQYLEFISSDLERAKQFYSASFGWSFTDYGPEYTAFDGKYVDGGFTVGTPINGSILVVLYSNDLVATRDKVTQAGGVIVKDIFSFPGGKRFQFKDPDGYELAVWATE
ncbi:MULTISPECIES: VOC family protein [Sphingobacterium]|uniref:Glyoxalase family protein n=1 Tax=Sphingobacterium athyrii TaxID=2152717 RepID=A0A363NYI0_9SPHI|nr:MULTISPECIES: VOC family protein [Sphingobacterium]PUV25862.1 glyoxalase family protein [Sphingobacterium athyrii]QIH33261.1 VOC family protein [Sphingobacterium sp. DR205]